MDTWIEIDVTDTDGYAHTVAEIGPLPDDEIYTDSFADSLSGLTVGDVSGHDNFGFWDLPVPSDTVIHAAYAVFKG